MTLALLCGLAGRQSRCCYVGRWRRGPNLRSRRARVGGATILKGVRIPLGFKEDFPALKPGCHVCLLNPSHLRQSCAGLLEKPVRARCAAIATPGDGKARSPTTAVARELSSNPETVSSSPLLKYHGKERREGCGEKEAAGLGIASLPSSEQRDLDRAPVGQDHHRHLPIQLQWSLRQRSRSCVEDLA